MDYGTEIAAPTPTREGYVFNYWLRGRRGDGYTIWYRPPIEAGEKITVTDNVTYYAQWTDIASLTQYTVTFNANGGIGSTSRTVEKGVEVGDLPAPIRDGYVFAGWFTTPDGGTQISASTIATADVTYYAHWLAKGPVSFTIKDGILTAAKLNNETEVTIPDGVMGIGERVFSQCGNLRSVTIPDSVKIIGRSAFSDCVSMTCVTIGNGVIGIGDSAFDRCGGLTSITIPDSVTSIGQFAFASCRSLTHVTIGKSVASVGWGAFSRCSALTSVTIPNSVTSIGHNAFGGCSGLTSVTIPNSVTSIGDGAFDGCVALKSIYVSPGDVDRVIGLVTSAGPGLDVSNVNFIEIGMSRVVFDANGGSVNEASRSVASGRAVGVLPAPTRAGYTFDGWWTMMSGGNKVSASTKVPENVTYYAHWKVNRCTVTFDANGGTGGKTVTQNYGTALTAPTVTRSGYVFMGWFPAVPTRVSADNVTYTAQWAVNRHNVNLVLNGGKGAASITVDYGAKVGDMPVPSRRGYEFLGWFNAAMGGRQIADDVLVTGDMTLYAQWHIVLPELYEMIDGAAPDMAASEYNGYLHDANTGAVAGSIQVKVGKANAKTGLAAVKATVVVGGAKKSLKAAEKGKTAISVDGPTSIRLVGGEPCEVTLGAEGLSGTYGSYFIDGARNFFTSKDKGEQNAANAILSKWLGAVNVAWREEGAARSVIAPYQTSSVAIGKKGKAKVYVTLANGTKAMVDTQLLVGEEWLCVPVVVTKKMNLAFTLWLPVGGGAAVVEGLPGDVVVGKAGALKAGAAFRIDAEAFSARWGQRALPYLPDGVSVTQSGARWTLPKAGKVQMAKDGTVDEAKLGGNPAALKLTYKAKDGSFKGSFKAYSLVNGKPKAVTVNVAGVVVDGVGYGTATVKKVGSVPISIE